MFAHYLFKFDFFFLIKGPRLNVWKIKELDIRGKGIRNMSYGNIGDQVKFIDSVKFYHESLSELAGRMAPIEREKIKVSLVRFIKSYPKFKFKRSIINTEEKNWIIDYLSGGKGVIPYKKLKSWEDLNDRPSPGEIFFLKTLFYSSLKKSMINDKEYNEFKKLYTLMKMSNLAELNAVYNVQDTIILGEIFVNMAHVMHDKFGYNPLKCSSDSMLSSAIQKKKIKSLCKKLETKKQTK